MTRRYGSGYVSDTYPSPFWYVSDSLFDISIKCRRKTQNLKRRTGTTALRLTHVHERKLAVPPLSIIPSKTSPGTKPHCLWRLETSPRVEVPWQDRCYVAWGGVPQLILCSGICRLSMRKKPLQMPCKSPQKDQRTTMTKKELKRTFKGLYFYKTLKEF